MSKAYDRVEWKFLEYMLHATGFPQHWWHLIMECVCSVSYSIIINGSQTDFFEPRRGLRQGDPLSPYLFILCAEGLSSLIRKIERQGLWSGIQMGRAGPLISHLLFADDSLFFAKADERSIQVIMEVLEIYGKASGPKVNFQKFQLYCSSNMSQVIQRRICDLLGVQVDDGKGLYLGLLYMIGRSKSEIFGFVKERVWKKLKGWKEKTLTQAGNDVLIKAVAQAIPTYVMSCFKLPKMFVREKKDKGKKFFSIFN